MPSINRTSIEICARSWSRVADVAISVLLDDDSDLSDAAHDGLERLARTGKAAAAVWSRIADEAGLPDAGLIKDPEWRIAVGSGGIRHLTDPLCSPPQWWWGLYHARILKIADVAVMTDAELLAVPSIGQKRLAEIRGVVDSFLADDEAR